MGPVCGITWLQVGQRSSRSVLRGSDLLPPAHHRSLRLFAVFAGCRGATDVDDDDWPGRSKGQLNNNEMADSIVCVGGHTCCWDAFVH